LDVGALSGKNFSQTLLFLFYFFLVASVRFFDALTHGLEVLINILNQSTSYHHR
jgi:hypothetical protein